MGLFTEQINGGDMTQPLNGGGGGGGFNPINPAPPVGISDPNPPLLPGGSTNPVPAPAPAPDPTPTSVASGPSLEDLYPVDPGIQNIPAPDLAATTETDKTVAEVATPGTATANIGILSEGQGIDASQAEISPDQLVDQELNRILGQNSPLMERARQEALQQVNRRGLQNTSIAVGAAQGAMVDRMLPMAQQNASQNFQRAQENTQLEQQAGMFTASELNRLRSLEAELGTSVSVFNSEQLNQAEQLAAQMRTAMEQQDAAAFNTASQQLARLQFEANAENAAAQNARDSQILAQVTQLNQQYLQGTQAMDLATIQGTYQQLISTNESAASLYNSYFAGISQVMADRKMTPQQIASAVAIQQRLLEAGLRMIAEINQADFGNVGGAPTTPFTPPAPAPAPAPAPVPAPAPIPGAAPAPTPVPISGAAPVPAPIPGAAPAPAPAPIAIPTQPLPIPTEPLPPFEHPPIAPAPIAPAPAPAPIPAPIPAPAAPFRSPGNTMMP